MRKYKAFWWIMGITALSYPGINYMVYFVYKQETNRSSQASQLAKLAIGNPFTFPEAWHTVAFLSSLFVFIPAVVVIMLISNEYTFKTHRQNIIDGWKRSQFITSKLLDVLIISMLITILYAVVAFIIGITNQDRLITHTWEQARYIGLFGLQTFAQLSIAFLVGFLIRKSFLALGVFLFYFLLLENLIVGLLRWKGSSIRNYLPLQISDGLVPMPAFLGKLDIEAYNRSLDAIPLHIILTIVLTTIVWLICYWINSRRDLK
jgi:ABC-type transport system involved in multi-copper enzyme maturation permease subunit